MTSKTATEQLEGSQCKLVENISKNTMKYADECIRYCTNEWERSVTVIALNKTMRDNERNNVRMIEMIIESTEDVEMNDKLLYWQKLIEPVIRIKNWYNYDGCKIILHDMNHQKECNSSTHHYCGQATSRPVNDHCHVLITYNVEYTKNVLRLYRWKTIKTRIRKAFRENVKVSGAKCADTVATNMASHYPNRKVIYYHTKGTWMTRQDNMILQCEVQRNYDAIKRRLWKEELGKKRDQQTDTKKNKTRTEKREQRLNKLVTKTVTAMNRVAKEVLPRYSTNPDYETVSADTGLYVWLTLCIMRPENEQQLEHGNRLLQCMKWYIQHCMKKHEEEPQAEREEQIEDVTIEPQGKTEYVQEKRREDDEESQAEREREMYEKEEKYYRSILEDRGWYNMGDIQEAEEDGTPVTEYT